MESRIPVREVNQNFSKYLKNVEKGARIIVTKYGHPVAQILPFKAKRTLTKEQMVARKKILRSMKKGFHLGIAKFRREDVYDR